MKRLVSLLLVALLGAVAGCKTGNHLPSHDDTNAQAKSWRAANPVWRGVHLMIESDEQVDALIGQLPKLSAAGVNVIVAEVDYSFDFQSHPELRAERFITKAGAQKLAKATREHGMRLIPQLNCLGHQSWSKVTLPLLVKYPQFDESPGKYPGNKDIYCRSWCPQNPEVNAVVFALVDELIDAFEADAFHVGMDEVFIMASEYCPRCHGGDSAKLFAKAVNDFHDHIVGKRKLEMLMWNDRLLDAKALGYSDWEASENGTAPAIDLIPKDIIMCDWHYAKRGSYPSLPFLLQKGFRVWPSGWQPLDAAQAFSAVARQQKNERLIGFLCTTWGKIKISDAGEWPPIVETLKEWK